MRMACCFWTVTALMMMMMMASPGVRSFPVGDSSGDEEFEADPCARISPTERSQPRASACLAHWLQGRAASWNAELCKEQITCKGSMDILIQNNLHILNTTPMNECYESTFQKEACLRKLSSGLYGFQLFLEYIEETSNNEASIWPGSQRLATNLRSMMNNPETVIMPLPENQKAISAKLREQKGWNATVIQYLILQDFTSFMEKTVRAVRHL